MDASLGTVSLWAVGIVLALGLLSAAFARRSEGSRRQTLSQVLFFGCLMLVGAAAIASVVLGPGCWAASSTTLAVMVLGATYDPRHSARSAVG
jgi:hypothetical protein